VGAFNTVPMRLLTHFINSVSLPQPSLFLCLRPPGLQPV